MKKEKVNNTVNLTDEALSADDAKIVEKKGTSRTLYFANSKDIQTLLDYLGKYPRANLSSVFGQVVEPLNEALAKISKDQRSVDLHVKIWL